MFPAGSAIRLPAALRPVPCHASLLSFFLLRCTELSTISAFAVKRFIATSSTTVNATLKWREHTSVLGALFDRPDPSTRHRPSERIAFGVCSFIAVLKYFE